VSYIRARVGRSIRESSNGAYEMLSETGLKAIAEFSRREDAHRAIAYHHSMECSQGDETESQGLESVRMGKCRGIAHSECRGIA
jgi:hypothetical protein